MIIGIVTLLGGYGTKIWNKNSTIGLFYLSAISIITAVLTLKNKYKGTGMAIAGIVTTSLAILAFWGRNKLNSKGENVIIITLMVAQISLEK